MKKSELLQFEAGLNSVSNLKGVKFAYAVAKNLGKIKPEIKAIKKANEPYENMVKYEKERLELCEKHGEKDKKGQLVTLNQKYVMKDKNTFDKDFKKLEKKHKEAIDQREDQLKKVKELLEEEVAIDLQMLNHEHLPEDITARQITEIEAMISE